MKKIILIFSITFFCFGFALAENKDLTIYEGNVDAKVIIKVYESLTCGHCADFHKKVYPKLKKDFIDTGLIKIEFRSFPLDLAAFNAAKIAHCGHSGKSKMLHRFFNEQDKWVKGETVEELAKNFKKYYKDVVEYETGINYEKCLNDKNIEDYILNDRIDAAKKFKINSTPTLIINDKKFDNPHNYKKLKKTIEKLI
jgi:protein-disulfide isomerase